MTATITKHVTTKKTQSSYRRLHVIVPIEDMLWASQQKSSVTQLWQECWTSDPYGSRWMPMITNLGYSTFIQAKKILSESGLFIFKPDKSIQDGRETVGWIVRNLHGSRMKDFWEEVDSTKQQPNSKDKEIDSVQEEMRASNQAPISGKTQSEQTFQEPSRTAQEHLTNSSKEFVRCDSSTPKENLPVDESAIAPLGGASPTIAEGVEENQDCGVEPRDCHEGTSSAAPAVLPLKTLTLTNTEILNILDAANQGVCPDKEAIAILLETPHARSLMGAITLNPQWGIKLSDDYSTVPQSSKLRSQRLNQLKSYAAIGECPPDEFLQECQSDPVLKIHLKRLYLCS